MASLIIMNCSKNLVELVELVELVMEVRRMCVAADA